MSHLTTKGIRNLIIKSLASQWELRHSVDQKLTEMIQLDQEYWKRHRKKTLGIGAVIILAAFAVNIKKDILALLCLIIIAGAAWDVHTMEYPGGDTWYTFMIRWKKAIENIHTDPRFQRVMDHVLEWRGVMPTTEDIERVIKQCKHFQELFDQVDINFSEQSVTITTL